MSILQLSPTTTRKVVAGVVAFLLVSLAIVRTSDAAFSAQTINDDNRFATGTISLDADHQVPLFGDPANGALNDATNLAGGDVIDACIEITYDGSFDLGDLTSVQAAVALGADPDDLAADLAVAADMTADCTEDADWAAMDSLAALEGSYDTTWTPDGDGDTRGFHFQVTVDDDAPQDATVSDVTLTWSIETDR